MDRNLSMGNSRENNARIQLDWELAKNSEFQARGGAENEQVQQWCSTDFYSPCQQALYSPYQPYFYPSFDTSFQYPHYNQQPDFPEIDPNFFQSQDSFQSFQCPAHGDSFSQFQNQEQPFYSQPPAFTEFQQGGQPYYEPQPLFFSEERLATLLEALKLETEWMIKLETEWLIKLEKEVEEFSSALQRAGFPWRNSESGMKNNEEEEEEKACDLMDKAQEWQMEVEERENGASEGQSREEVESRHEEEEEQQVEEIDYNLYPMFRIGERVMAYDQFVEEKGKRMEEKRIAAAMQRLAELDVPFPAAINRTLPQREEEATKRKLEEKELLSLLLAKEKEGEKGKILDEDDYFSLLFRKEEEAKACVVHQQKRRKKRRKKKKKMDAIQCPLQEEVAIIEETSDLDFLLQEVQSLFQKDLSYKGEGEKEESLQISPSSPHLHNLNDKEVTSSDSHSLLHEVCSITAGQPNEEQQQQQLEVVEEVAAIKLLCDELEMFLLHSAQQQERVGKEQNLTVKGPLLLVEKGEAELLTELLNSALEIHNEQQQVVNAEEVVQLEAQYKLLQEEEEAKELELFQAIHFKKVQQQGVKEKLEAELELPLLDGEQNVAALTCADLDILEQEADYLLQHYLPSKEQGEENQISPYSLELLRVKEKDVEDFTESDFDFLLLEENAIQSGQHPFKEEKKQEEEQKVAITPCLQVDEVSELHLPQDTTPRQKEAAVYPSTFNSFTSEFELTLNKFLLSLKLFISGNKLQEQQLSFYPFCKLQSIAEFGEVHKQGTHGDGVPWFIKVHPP